MNFPDTQFFQFLYWLINTPGVGGVVVGLLSLGIFIVIGLTLRWITHVGDIDDNETYAYPTPALHRHVGHE